MGMGGGGDSVHLATFWGGILSVSGVIFSGGIMSGGIMSRGIMSVPPIYMCY